MALFNTEIIDNLNNRIEGVLEFADNMTESINHGLAVTNEVAQDYIDEKGVELGEKISEKGNEIRDKAVEIFSAQYQSALEKLKPIEPLVNADVSLDTVVDIVKSIIAVLIAPYQPIIDFTLEVIPKVLQLSDNILKLATYQPPLVLPPGVTPPEIPINIKPITIKDITGGNDS